jgi:hypothetical protein
MAVPSLEMRDQGIGDHKALSIRTGLVAQRVK